MMFLELWRLLLAKRRSVATMVLEARTNVPQVVPHPLVIKTEVLGSHGEGGYQLRRVSHEPIAALKPSPRQLQDDTMSLLANGSPLSRLSLLHECNYSDAAQLENSFRNTNISTLRFNHLHLNDVPDPYRAFRCLPVETPNFRPCLVHPTPLERLRLTVFRKARPTFRRLRGVEGR